MSDWQLIETFDGVDGQEVDVWMEISASPRSLGWGDSFRVPNAYPRRGKWFHRTESGEEKGLIADYITHWMPLPPPPSASPANPPRR